MSKLKYLPLLFVCLLVSSGLHAQFMNYGSDPARFKWNIVRLPHYNLVYPQGCLLYTSESLLLLGKNTKASSRISLGFSKRIYSSKQRSR